MNVIRRRLATWFLNGGAGLMILGGIGDVLIPAPPDAWSQVLGQPASSLTPAVARLLMALLHAHGSALVASGLAALFLINGPLRRGGKGVAAVIALIVVLSDGVNGFQMYRIGVTVFWAPLAFAALVLLGLVLLFLPPAVFPAPVDEQRKRLDSPE